ncbi:hypothetical protein QBC45DRAFT_154150 [Copromyces sp. CBS 386.78]|nr:hypothetical protein QBC45DRAFT_154150 [Copromyces sp. CBS 386.78]
MAVINGPIPPFITFFVFSLALTNAAPSIHSANIRGRLASYIVAQDAADNEFFLTRTTPTTKQLHPATTLPFTPEASCMVAIFSLISDIPMPGPALSTALDKAEDALAPSAVAGPQCTITLPASLSSEYGVYTSRVDIWVSQHSQELDKLDSVCRETFTQTGQGPGCTAPVAIFTGATTGSAGTTGGGGGNTTAKATKSGTGVVTTTTVTASSTSSITGPVTTVAGATSSTPAEGPKAGGAVRVTGVMAAAMVVAGLLAVVVAL